MDVTFRAVIGPDGTIELQGSPTDRSEPDLEFGVYAGHGVALGARWPMSFTGS